MVPQDKDWTSKEAERTSEEVVVGNGREKEEGGSRGKGWEEGAVTPFPLALPEIKEEFSL
jgi:hypothetical protein